MKHTRVRPSVSVVGCSAAERRAHVRLNVSQVPFISEVRLKSGPAVTLIDISSGGAQIDTSWFGLQPGSRVILEVTGQQGKRAVPAQVLRAQLTSVRPEPIYRASLAFTRPIDLVDFGADSVEPVPQLNPTQAERLGQLLTPLVFDTSGLTSADVLVPTVSDALVAALSTLDTLAVTCEPLDLRFQILKAGVQLIAIARELGRQNGPDRPLENVGHVETNDHARCGGASGDDEGR
jgi:hypothetical protein